MKAIARLIMRFFDSIPETSERANTVFRWILIITGSVMVFIPSFMWLAGDDEWKQSAVWMAVGEIGLVGVYVIGYTAIMAVAYVLLLFVRFVLPEEEIHG